MYNMIFAIQKYPNGALQQKNIFQVNLHQEVVVYTVNIWLTNVVHNLKPMQAILTYAIYVTTICMILYEVVMEMKDT